jgi:agmatinase
MESKVYPRAYGAVPEMYRRYETASIAILPIPYDGTSTWMKGSNRGPKALLDASANMELYDIETDSEVFRRGIVTMDPVSCPADPQDMVAAVYQAAKKIISDGKFVVGIGGEHSISVGIVRAMAEKFQNLCVLQFDAHADARDQYEGSPYNHACVMSRIGEICSYVQVGIRSMDVSEGRRLDPNRIFFAHDILRGADVAPKILGQLSNHVYITIDLDVLDPSIMPSTGTPEPGGLGWHTLLGLIESVVMEKHIIGMDVTELLPNPVNKAPDFAAAKLVYRVLSMIFANRKAAS